MENEIKTVPEAETTVEVVDIQFRPGQKVYFFDPNGLKLEAGDHVIIDTARGPEYGTCTGGNHHIRQKDVVSPLRCVLRVATDHDEKIAAENKAKEKRAYEVCLQKIADHGLDMQLVSAEVSFDGSKILFFFTADERVDFRELVKNLASIFHTRIELRQIGVRDKAKMVGGLGICGRPFCCASFLDDFQPVSIKMAKTQNLSLNPTKISGTCGRLMCCLKYEQETYEDLIRNSPKVDSFVDTPEGRGTVIELDLLRSRVKVRMEDSPETVSLFSNSEIAILRNGKAKKNDPPIPADLAPISGNGKRQRKVAEEDKILLDPIRFRYSTEKIVEEPELPVIQEAAPEVLTEEPEVQTEPKSGRSHRRNRSRTKPQEEAPKQEAQTPVTDTAEKPEKPRNKKKKQPQAGKRPEAVQEAVPAPDTDEAAENIAGDGQPKKHRRRPPFRRRKPKAPGAQER